MSHRSGGHRRARFAAALISTAALAIGSRVGVPPASAAAFLTNDLYLLSPSLPGGGIGILRVQPTTGSISSLCTLVSGSRSTLTYDSWRDRLVTANAGPGGGLLAIDATGVKSVLGSGLEEPWLVAARGDGILYMWLASVHGFRYIDAAGVDHDLLDPSGTARFGFPGATTPDELIYDPNTNSLIVFDGSSSLIAQCPDATKSCAIKLPLSASGGQVVGPVTSVQVFISSSGSVVQGSGFTGGRILWHNDTNSNAQEPRVQLLDTTTMVTTTYASPGPPILVGGLNGGTWSHARAQAIVVDTFSDSLRAYSSGGTGGGTSFAYPISPSGSSGEVDRIVEIRSSPFTTSVDGGAGAAMPASGSMLAPRGANPFARATTLAFELPAGGQATLTIHDVTGREVRVIADGEFARGRHEATWDGIDATGQSVAPGIYFARLSATGTTMIRKLVLQP